MKVLIDCVPLTVGGGVQVAISLLVGLQRQSSVDWLAVLPSVLRTALPPELANHARIKFVDRRSQADRLWLAPLLLRLERKFAPDLVFTVFGPPFFQARAPHLVGFAMPRLIYEPDADFPWSNIIHEVGDRVRKALFRRADHIVVETAIAKARVVSHLDIDASRISIIPNAANPLFDALPDTAPRPGWPVEILIPSAYYKHKNLEIVPAVAAAILRRAPHLDFVFRFTLPESSREWRRIKEDAERRGVGPQVSTLGTVKITDLARAYQHATAIYLPTLREVSTAVYPESFLARRPLVTTDIDFARELCGQGAIFVRPRDPDEAAARLLELAASPERAAAIVAAGSRQLATNYPTAAAKFQMQLELMKYVACAKQARPKVIKQTNSSPVLSRTRRGDAISFHDALAAEWDAKYTNGRFRRRAEFFETEILPQLPHKGRWLDAGCGTGYFSRLMATRGSEVVGLDASRQMIEEAQHIAEHMPIAEAVRFEVIGTLEKLGYESAAFDGVLCLSVVEYLDRPADCFEELSRVLRPGGTLVISAPHYFSPIRLTQRLVSWTFGKFAPEKWEYATLSRHASTTKGLRSTLRRHGFTLTHAVGFDSALPSQFLKVVPPSLLFAIAIKEPI